MLLGDGAVEAVRELRAEYVPAAFAGSGASVLVTGTTAENIDYFDVMSRWLPIVLVFVLGPELRAADASRFARSSSRERRSR